jgi:glycosyltransferase involved in cell wall biosynthesis
MNKISKRIVFWGTYDKGKPRVRILLDGAKSAGIEVVECHSNIWKGVEDKSQLHGISSKLRRIASLFLSYPILIFKYILLPSHDLLFIGYMGLFDILIIWPLARLRKIPICWDVFLSLYDTVVVDRRITSKKSITAKILYSLEWLGTRAADLLLMDTKTHARYLEKLFKLPYNSVQHIYVGAELEKFKENKHRLHSNSDTFTVLFYGQFIPLHGIDTIVHAAKLTEKLDKKIRWQLIGKGQESPRIDALIKRQNIRSIQRISWVPYESLIDFISRADICLGIFGTTGKAQRVIPNKVFQILSASKPIITSDTPAIRELLEESRFACLIPPGNASALANNVIKLKETINNHSNRYHSTDDLVRIGKEEIGKQFIEAVKHF